MCRVQQGSVSCLNTACHFYLGHFSSLCQYLVLLALESPAPSPTPAFGVEGPSTLVQVTQRRARHRWPHHTLRASPHPWRVTVLRCSLVCLCTKDMTQLPSLLSSRTTVPCLGSSAAPVRLHPAWAPALLQCRQWCQQHQLVTTFPSVCCLSGVKPQTLAFQQ